MVDACMTLKSGNAYNAKMASTVAIAWGVHPLAKPLYMVAFLPPMGKVIIDLLIRKLNISVKVSFGKDHFAKTTSSSNDLLQAQSLHILVHLTLINRFNRIIQRLTPRACDRILQIPILENREDRHLAHA